MAGRASIYEVFRACRLCGSGGGYKMPIINPEDELDMRHKIRECVRIEVHQDDKMPPLICELCVDKVNDYFEFLEMCRSIDTRTRNRLGLPQSTQSQNEGDADCILGVTEPVFVNDDSNDGEPLARQKNRLVVGGKGKRSAAAAVPARAPAPAARRRASPVPIVTITRGGAKDTKMGMKELRVSMNGSRGSGSRESLDSVKRESRGFGKRESRGSSSRESSAARGSPAARGSRATRRAPSPPAVTAPATRRSRRDDSRDTLNKLVLREKEKKLQTPSPKETRTNAQKGIIKTKAKVEDSTSLLREKRSKRELERERAADDASAGAAKRVKIAAKPAAARAEKRRAPTPPRPEPKRRAKPEPPAPPQPQHPCALCGLKCAKSHNLASHMRVAHSPTFTQDKLACNACGEWFGTVEEAATHHRWHKSAPAPYVCRLCTAEFRQPASYAKHFASRQCVPSPEVPDVQCPTCWGQYATDNLLQQHKCRGEDARPGGNCAKCKRKYATYKTLRKHEEVCCKPGPKSKSGAFKASPEMLKRVTPMQIRMARCDPLLERVKLERHYDVSHITPNFGLDKSCVYPYTSSMRIKTEPPDYDIGNVKDELFDYQDDFANYESFTDSDSEPESAPTATLGPNLVPNPFARKKKTIDALSTLSIKAIFSNKFLGAKKIKRKRKRRPIIKPEIKTENEENKTGDDDAFDSLINDPIDKEAKKEMIEAANAPAETGILENGEKSLADKSDSNTAVMDSEMTTADKTSLENICQDDVNVEKGQESVDKDLAINQDVSLALNDLIADISDTVDDSTDKTSQDAPKDACEIKPDEKGAVDGTHFAEAATDLEKDNKIEGEVQEEVKEAESDDKLIEKLTPQIERNEKDTKSKEGEFKTSDSCQEAETNENDTKSKEGEFKISDSSQEAEITCESDSIDDNNKQAAINDDRESESEANNHENITAGANDKSKESSKLEDDVDFDVNSMFSGDLGPVALKSKGKPVTTKSDKQDAAESAETQNETENPKIDIRLAGDISIGDVQNESEEVQNGESEVSKVIGDSFSDNVGDMVSAKENISVSVDKADLSEDKPVENKLDVSIDKLDDKESKPPENDASEDDLLGDKPSDSEFDNLSDTEMDDKELMDALDAQISNNSPEKPLGESSTEPEKTDKVKEIKEPSPDAPGEESRKKETAEEDESKAVKSEERKASIETEERLNERAKVEEKISLDDLLKASGAAKSTDDKLRQSMDLDCISDDEFNFDA